MCNGIPQRDKGYGGMWGQRLKLLKRVHPKTGMLLPEHRNLDGSLWGGLGSYQADMQGLHGPELEATRDDGFYRYVPEELPITRSNGSGTNRICFSELLSRVRMREASRGVSNIQPVGEVARENNPVLQDC